MQVSMGLRRYRPRQMHCPLCGKRLTKTTRTRDHFWPRSLEGARGRAWWNIWHLCRRCNVAKANRMPSERETLAFCAIAWGCYFARAALAQHQKETPDGG